ncbi:trimethyllysine dioxygenase, mitochondrial-like [Pollicipes pollicipes]|uniref:trimethyllysine dioxygenase, mitochondrial-like n=1 Tax=Pollicipes pollicipes TaxID=41117 RepID=UPI001885433C|nr:trimethyllysine dioxygenase, mitochondrial-like [Pollicipes pollicipes]
MRPGEAGRSKAVSQRSEAESRRGKTEAGRSRCGAGRGARSRGSDGPAPSNGACYSSKHARSFSKTSSRGTTAGPAHKNVIQDDSAVTLYLHGSHLVVQHPRWPAEDVLLPLVWLRDHCRCPSCYNTTTHQRQTDVRDLVFDVHPSQFAVDQSGTSITITWHDGHESKYSLQWLWENSYISQKYRQMQQDRVWKRCLWDAWTAAREDLPTVHHDQFMQDEAGVRQMLKGFLTHGVVTVTGVSASLEATRRVIERVGAVQNTIFGDVVQVFHCLHHDGTGGETTLVDGFAGLQRLHAADPAAYQLLSTEPCLARRLRFNPYDRAPARHLSPARLEPFYRAYQRLAETLLSPRLERRLRLTPGTVLFIDNWRVLHGRAAFTGRRVMCGGYGCLPYSHSV